MNTGGDETGTEILRDGRIAGPWTCLRCRYIIQNLRPADPCPECGGTLDPSLDPRLLRFGPPGTIDRVRRGARGIEYSVLTAILSIPVIGIYFATVDGMEDYGIALELSYFLNGPWFPMLLLYAVTALLARSVFRYTTPLPASCEPSRATGQLRRTLRAFSIAIPVLFTPFTVVLMLEWLGVVRFGNSVPEWIPALCASLLLAVVVSLVLGFSLYAWSIGDRIWSYGKPLRSFAAAPAVFALIAAILALPLALIAEFSTVFMYVSVWGFAQWAFFSLWLAGSLFAIFAVLLSFAVVHAVGSAAKRDFRESSAANRESPS